MRKLFIFLLLGLAYVNVYGQGEIDEQQRIFYRNERTGAIFLNSNGIGLGFQYGKRVNASLKTLYSIEVANIKHPKEVKVTNQFASNKSFVYGKQNNFFTLHGGIGRQKEIFRKFDRGGIAVRYFYNGGVSLGFIKPIYYEVYNAVGPGIDFVYLEDRKFDPSIHQGDIFGRSGFFKGIDEISLAPGAYARVGFNFEYSTLDELIHAIEVGIAAEAFTRKIPIMATQENFPFFFSLFLSYRFGKVINPLDTESLSPVDNLFLD